MRRVERNKEVMVTSGRRAESAVHKNSAREAIKPFAFGYKYLSNSRSMLQVRTTSYSIRIWLPEQIKYPHPTGHNLPQASKMHFSAIATLATFVVGILASPARLEARADCNNILPACFGGSVVGQIDCPCEGQVPACDMWSCPGDAWVSYGYFLCLPRPSRRCIV